MDLSKLPLSKLPLSKLQEKTPDAPKIEFPCDDYMIKVMGDNCIEFRALVVEVLQQFDERISETSFRENPSKNGRFTSLTVRMRIEQEADLATLDRQLKASPMVKMVL
ncbi:YbeD family protein [Reinekea thalattae]|uniref:DUF493 domain-containing protein n=1 Tax=Reinekea thalattae TaxID=2593301 RepID=A0A5C8ZBH5_9GAMM|nr:DUF493 domain-containing protein [Reinekea thalattae]TXR54246.1 DUF493 domain-containing protein [Reinekea thalattae]